MWCPTKRTTARTTALIPASVNNYTFLPGPCQCNKPTSLQLVIDVSIRDTHRVNPLHFTCGAGVFIICVDQKERA